jgi:hypothetical protein
MGLDALRRSLVVQKPVMDRQEPFLHQAAPGEARQLMDQLVMKLLQKSGRTDLNAEERKRLGKAIESVNGFQPGFPERVASTLRSGSARPVQLTVEDVKGIAETLGLTVGGLASPEITLARDSKASRWIRSLPVQPASKGVGPLMTRTYAERLTGVSADALFNDLAKSFPKYADPSLAHFYKLDEGALKVGDRMYIRGYISMPADQFVPDDVQMGVRVKSIVTQGKTKSLTLETLKGHFEAGTITFSVTDLGKGQVKLQVQSDARFGGLVSLAAFPVASKKMQEAIWMSFLSRVAKIQGATVVGTPTSVMSWA